jgi:hypothetical protein
MSQAKLKELAKRYELGQDDFWQLPQNNRVHILTHDACEKIASIEGVRYEKPEWLSKGEGGVWAVQASGYKSDDPENILWTTGEASKQNCTAKYLVNMAEKRAKDRLVLKLIKAYEYGIKSEEEADEFKKPDTEVTTADKPVEKPSSNGKKEPISSLAERKRAWKELTTEAVNRISGMTETEDGNRIDAWKDTVQKKLIELYGESHQYDRKSVPVEKLEVSQIAHAFKELFPDMVEAD